MKNYLESFFKRYDIPEWASAELLETYGIIEKNGDFMAMLKKFYEDENLRLAEIDPILVKIGDDTGVHPYKVKYLYYVCLTKQLPALYRKKGIDESVMWDSLEDFKYKMLECIEVHGIPAFFACGWFYDFLRADLFKLGRMEYHIIKYSGDTVEIGGTVIRDGDSIINVHIPSSGERFDAQSRYESYEKAYRFFRDVIGVKVSAFTCHSWLLFPKHREILDEKSNIVSFMNDFRFVSDGVFKEPREDMWRIFGKYADAPAQELPRDSALRRAYADYLEAGGYPGWGMGVFVWDDENKCPCVN